MTHTKQPLPKAEAIEHWQEHGTSAYLEEAYLTKGGKLKKRRIATRDRIPKKYRKK